MSTFSSPLPHFPLKVACSRCAAKPRAGQRFARLRERADRKGRPVPYSFPEFRRGGVFGTQNHVTPEASRRLAEAIQQKEPEYWEQFKSIVVGKGASDLSRPEGEKVELEPVAPILNFPTYRFRFGDYIIDARISATVCSHWRFSKIWLRFVCVELYKSGEELPTVAKDLVERELEDFFEKVAELADIAMEELSSLYLNDATRHGFLVEEGERYSFRFKTFNDTDPVVQDLNDELRRSPALEWALNSERYKHSLNHLFALLKGQVADKEEILTQVNNEELDFFTYDYGMPSLVTSRSDEKGLQAVAVGYGSAEVFKKNPSHLAGVGLAREYGSQF